MAPLLTRLPAELLRLIVGYLPNKDIKALRLTCRTLCNAAQLRLDRVFLSANPLNIAVFRAVADSDTYRHAEEIEDPQWEDDQEHEWFIHEMMRNKEDIPYRRGGAWVQEARLRTLVLPRISPQQEDVIISKRDAEALWYGLKCYRSRLLSRALANAHDLEHFSLHTNVSPDAATDTANYSGGDPRAGWVPLRTIVPVESRHSLRHFGLSGFHVDKDDLIELLKLMPALHSLFLGHLYFVNNGGCLRELLDDMRDKLDWRARDPAARPTIFITVPTDYQQIGHAVWVDKEVAEFMYGQGPNPWLRSGMVSIVTPHEVIRDAFLPGAEWSTWPFDD
ncbi:hypothetical protein BJX62DRAFT_244308 [Aspergillus germanicus]